MKRAQYEQELRQFKESRDESYVESMVQYFLREWDDTQRELGYTRSLRDNLQQTVATNVELEIEVQQLRQKLEHATRVKKEEEDD